MKRFDDEDLRKASEGELREASARLEAQIRQSRQVRVRIWKELERRATQAPAGSAGSGAQVVMPDHFEADVKVNGEPESRRARWWSRRVS